MNVVIDLRLLFASFHRTQGVGKTIKLLHLLSSRGNKTDLETYLNIYNFISKKSNCHQPQVATLFNVDQPLREERRNTSSHRNGRMIDCDLNCKLKICVWQKVELLTCLQILIKPRVESDMRQYKKLSL